jgi:hypothetical protein
MTDHRITGSPDHPILSSLSLFILSTIHRHGPQSDMSIWSNTRSESLTAVILATATLNDEGFLERIPTHQHPQRWRDANDLVTYWQLTEKGKQQVAAQTAAQEVSLGS